jgi:hypothetical protein
MNGTPLRMVVINLKISDHIPIKPFGGYAPKGMNGKQRSIQGQMVPVVHFVMGGMLQLQIIWLLNILI